MIRGLQSKQTLPADFGARVRQFRESLGLTQTELAERGGLNRNYFGAVERGEKNVTILSIGKIAKALNVPIDVLFGGGSPNPR